jgi:hypothetical protein
MTPRREREKLTEQEVTTIGRHLNHHPKVKSATIAYSSYGYPIVIVRTTNGRYFSIATTEDHLDVMGYLATLMEVDKR